MAYDIHRNADLDDAEQPGFLARLRQSFADYREYLGSGVYNQKMTVAAMQMALMKVWAQRSYRVAMRRQSLSLPNMRSMRLRCL